MKVQKTRRSTGIFAICRASALCAAFIAAPSFATNINLNTNGDWYQFDVDELIAQSGGLEWIDGVYDPIAGYTGDGSALSFTFTLATQGLLTVVDAGVAGDEFGVSINGTNYFTSVSNDPDSTSVGTNFDAALSDTHRYSYLTTLLNPGSYTVTGAMTLSALDGQSNPLNATVGGIRVSAVPVPAAIWLLGSALASGFCVARRRRV